MSDSNKAVILANHICQTSLVGSFVESYGIWHQTPFIDFRNDTEDIRLSIQSKVVTKKEEQFANFTDEEKLMLCFCKINLQEVTGVFCSEAGSLTLAFKNNVEIVIGAESKSENTAELWQLSNFTSSQDPDYMLVIALSEGGYAIWGSIPD